MLKGFLICSNFFLLSLCLDVQLLTVLLRPDQDQPRLRRIALVHAPDRRV